MLQTFLLCLEEFTVEYKNYVAKKRAKFEGISGSVNIPYGTRLENQDGFLMLNGKPVCAATSQNGLDYFAQNDDGQWEERGKLTIEIHSTLTKRDKKYQTRWDKVWEDAICKKYRREEHEDFWLWNQDFYTAPIADLRHIKELIKV